MSLGVKSLWRAQSCAWRLRGLSLIPRESFRPSPLQLSVTRQWFATQKLDDATPASPSSPVANSDTKILKGSTPSAVLRQTLRRAIKQRSQFGLEKHPLVQPANIPSSTTKNKRPRSLRKHQKSAANQHLLDAVRDAGQKQPSHWYSTLLFMLRNTPTFEEIFDFKVTIGKVAFERARGMLSGVDTNIWQIRQRNESVIRIEEPDPQDDSLVISLSGSEVSVRKSMLEIVRATGRITAIRVSDPTLKRLLSDAEVPVKLLNDGQIAADDQTMTVHRGSMNTDLLAPSPVKYAKYVSTRRADEIPLPTEVTKASFERYVASLVYGQVPTHLARQLYPEGPDHQTTVITILVDIFTSDRFQSAISVSALKIALRYIHSKGKMFRPAARAVFHQAEVSNLPLDSETFNTFLTSASRAKDLDSFNSVLRMMVRKRHYPHRHTWTAFSEMFQNEAIRYQILRKMRSKGLNRHQDVLKVMGSQVARQELDHVLPPDFSVRRFVEEKDQRFCPGWLNTMVLNQMVYAFGSHGNLHHAYDLLDLIYETRRSTSFPDAITLNTLITHTRSLPQQLAALHSVMSRWRFVQPSAVTYNLLFQAAWKQRLPNMLRVILRYAVFARLTGSKMRYRLNKVLNEHKGLSNQRAFLKSWEDVIFGQEELRFVRSASGETCTFMDLERKYLDDAGLLRPQINLASKALEAYRADKEIQKLIREGAFMSASERQEHAVNIPLELPKPIRSTKRIELSKPRGTGLIETATGVGH
ncbi:hypothetical protein F5Y15DRAFT_395289 [Xylariaceae sp. FL0016]|nr:hypothetical protein F5Y15DRAFT_395289 [Xylariaceae sp. FL0016]